MKLCPLTSSPLLSLEDRWSTAKKIWFPKGHKNALGSYFLLSFLYNDDKPLIKTWLCTPPWDCCVPIFSYLILTTTPWGKYHSFCPGCGGLEKVNNLEVSYNLYLFDSKASNSLSLFFFFFGIRTTLHFEKLLRAPKRFYFSYLLIFTALKIQAVKNFKSLKYTSKHFISHLGDDVITLFSL